MYWSMRRAQTILWSIVCLCVHWKACFCGLSVYSVKNPLRTGLEFVRRYVQDYLLFGSFLHMDVFCVRMQIFLTMILAIQRWILCAHNQVPWDMDVFCVCTQIFLKMILAFQRWIICAYEQVPRDRDVFFVHSQIFLKKVLSFQRWIICTSLLRFGE